MSCLTRKQNWRRTSRKGRPPSEAFIEEMNRSTPFDCTIQISSASALPVAHPQLDVKETTCNPSKYTDSLTIKNKEKNPRRIKFDNRVNVILIPSRDEYYQIGLGEALWWTGSDYTAFKQSAGIEFRAMLALCNMDAKTAIALMYQSDSKGPLISLPDRPAPVKSPLMPTSASDSTVAQLEKYSKEINATVSHLKHVNSIQVLHDTKCCDDDHAIDIETDPLIAENDVGLDVNAITEQTEGIVSSSSSLDSDSSQSLTVTLPKNCGRIKSEQDSSGSSSLRKSSSLTDIAEANSKTACLLTKAGSTATLLLANGHGHGQGNGRVGGAVFLPPPLDVKSPRKVPSKTRDGGGGGGSMNGHSSRSNIALNGNRPLPIIIS